MKNHHDHHDPPPPPLAENNDSSPNNLDIIDDDDSSRNNVMISYSPTRAQEIVRERHQVDMSSNNEDMDPIEWTVRKLAPLPAVYYWDVSVTMVSDEKGQDNAVSDTADDDNNDNSNDQMKNETAMKAPPPPPPQQQQQEKHQPMSADMVPWKIRFWHESIYSLSIAGDFITRWIAQPIAGALGMTQSSPFSYVFDNMTRQEWDASQQRAREQCRKNQQRRQQAEQQAGQERAEQTEYLEDTI